VRLTYDLFAFARENQYLLFDDKQGRRMRIPLDLNLDRFLKTE